MVSERLKGRYMSVDVSTAKELDQDAEKLINDIFEHSKDDRPLVRIPENEFYHAWLPLFTGEPSPYGYVPQYYINRIGGIYREALVVDPRTNEVLFKVPPICDQEANNPVLMKTPNLEIGHSLDKFNDVSRVRPHAALADLRTILMAHVEVMRSRKQNDKYLDEWNEIFRRYGKPEVVMPRSGKSSGTNKATPVDEQEPDTYQDI